MEQKEAFSLLFDPCQRCLVFSDTHSNGRDFQGETNFPFFCVNPFIPGKLEPKPDRGIINRHKGNIQEIHGFTIEYDREPNLEEQKRRVWGIFPDGPTVANFSGNKSIHHHFRFSPSVKVGSDAHKELISMLKAVFDRRDKGEAFRIDTGVLSNPCSLVRTPGGKRDSGETQTIEFLGRRYGLQEILAILEAAPKAEKKKPESSPFPYAPTADETFFDAVLSVIEDHPGALDDYNDWLKFLMACKAAGLHYNGRVDAVCAKSEGYNYGRNLEKFESEIPRCTFGSAYYLAAKLDSSSLRERIAAVRRDELSESIRSLLSRSNSTAEATETSEATETAATTEATAATTETTAATTEATAATTEATAATTETRLFSGEKKREIELDLSACHEFFPTYIDSVGETEAGKEHIATTLLVAAASALGNRSTLRLANGIRPNLYAVLLGESTFARKTTSMTLGLAPLAAVSRKKKAEYTDKANRYAAEMLMYNQKTKKEKSQISPPEKPSDSSNFYPDEFSPEKLIEAMQAKPDGLFRYSEMAELLAAMEAGYMVGMKERLTSWYDAIGNDYTRETKGGGILIVKNPCPSIIGCSTLAWLQTHLRDADLVSGFLARFVFVARRTLPSQIVALPDFFEPSEDSVSVFRKLDSFSCERLTLSQGARAWYRAFYENFYAETRAKDVLLHSFLGRLANVLHKVAIVNYALDAVIYGMNSGELSEENYAKAMPWFSLFAANIESLYTDLTAKTSLDEEKILAAIRKHGVRRGEKFELSLGAIYRFANMKKKETLDLLETLQAKELIAIVQRGKYTFVHCLPS